MGAAASAKYTEHDFRCLQLNAEDIRKIFGIFSKIDKESKGAVKYSTIINYLQIKPAPFMETLFQIFDTSQDDSIDAKTFVFFTWNYCTLTHLQLASFLFALFCKSENGSMSSNEVVQMFHDIHGVEVDGAVNSTDSALTYDMVDDIYSNSFNLQYFLHFIKIHSNIMDPLYEFQRTLKQSTLSIELWALYGPGREAVCGTTVPCVQEFLKQYLYSPSDTAEGSEEKAEIPTPKDSYGKFLKIANMGSTPRASPKLSPKRSMDIEKLAMEQCHPIDSPALKPFIPNERIFSPASSGCVSYRQAASNSTVMNPTISSVQETTTTTTTTNNKTSNHSSNQRQSYISQLTKSNSNSTIGSSERPTSNNKPNKGINLNMSLSVGYGSSGASHTPALTLKPPPATTKATSNYYKDDHSATVMKAEVKITRMTTKSAENKSDSRAKQSFSYNGGTTTVSSNSTGALL